AWAEPHFGRMSAYNGLFPGRPRFPFGETPREAYNFSLLDLDAMFAAHEISAQRSPAGSRPETEFRVFLIGDSSVWGTLLRPEETLAGQLNAYHLAAADGRVIRFYNLGYPTISLTKDLDLLDRAMGYRPDLVIWLVTLEAFPRDKQLAVPLLQNNPESTAALLARYKLDLPGSLVQPAFFDRTLIGRRKNLADLIRLQFYGVLWAATGIDQVYPLDFPRAQVDLEADPTFHEKEDLQPADLAFEVLAAGQSAVANTPILLVNEPIMISSGANSDIRYNFYYPRLAYDQYRDYLSAQVKELGLDYIDAWDLVPQQDFTNSAIHLNRAGTARLVEVVKDFILSRQ
ncbi:MAG: hypothetical protein IH586_23385, partial [Anaerolineaceae bacterium]|nr:hypothetical protein [Anaerolineaceae bacterium]